MVSICKKGQSKRRLFSQLDDFDQDIIIGIAASERQENIIVNEGSNDRDFTVGTSTDDLVTTENTVNVKTLERCFNESIDRELSNIIETVEDRIRNAILTAIDNIDTPRIELANRSLNASSGRDATSVTANSEHVRINASFENASGNNNVLHVSNVNDETRHNISDEVSELSVPETRFDRQTHTHHICISSWSKQELNGPCSPHQNGGSDRRWGKTVQKTFQGLNEALLLPYCFLPTSPFKGKNL